MDANARGKMHIALNSGANSSNVALSDAKLTVQYNGNVGIGTTAPVAKLDVVGDVRLSGRISQGSLGDLAEMMPLAGCVLKAPGGVFSTRGQIYSSSEVEKINLSARSNDTSGPRSNGITVPRSNDTSGPRSNGITVPRSNDTSGPRSNSIARDEAITKALVESDAAKEQGSDNILRASKRPTLEASREAGSRLGTSPERAGLARTVLPGLARTIQDAALAAPEPGDVVAIDENGGIRRSFEPCSTKVVGIISTTPAQILRDGLKNAAPVTLSGIVPCKVCNENGMIKPGDLLVSSSRPGHAMRAGSVVAPGTVIAKALEKLDENKETGVIEVVVMLR